MSAITWGDIPFKIGSVNPSGLSGNEAFWAHKDWITAFPTMANDPDNATLETYINYSGSFAMASGATFLRLYTTQGKGSFTSEAIGEKDVKMYNNTLTLSFPKITDEVRGFVKLFNNGDAVLVVKHDGKYYVFGNQDYRNDITCSISSGDEAGSAKGVTITAVVPDVTPCACYTGTLALSDGTLDCSTGVFTPSNATQSAG